MAKAKSTQAALESLAEESNNRHVYLYGYVEEEIIKNAVKRIFDLVEEDTAAPIDLIINTYGGDVDEAFALYDVITYARVQTPIRTLGLGKVMSAGCLILAAGTKGERRIASHARMMYHAGYETNGGDVLQQEIALAEFKRNELLYDELFAACCDQSLDAVQALYLPHRIDCYMTAAETVAFGAADKIL